MTRPQNQPRYTADQVADAIRAANGLVTVAARNLDCSPSMVHKYAQRHASVREALTDSRERTLDFAEAQLVNLVKEGNVAATIFLLKTLGKARGYVERVEQTGQDGGPVSVVIRYADD